MLAIRPPHALAAIARVALPTYVASVVVLLALGWVVPRLPVVGEAIVDADRAAVDAIADGRDPDGGLTRALTAVGSLADPFVIIGLVAVVVVVLGLAGRWRSVALLLIAVPLEAAIFATVATISGRARPVSAFEDVELAGGFPSGHAAVAVACYGGLAVVVRWLTDDPRLRGAAVAAAVVLAVLIGAARLHLTMHHPTDVLVGWAMGAVCLAVAVPTSRHAEAPDPAVRTGDQP